MTPDLTDPCPGCGATTAPCLTEESDDRVHGLYACSACDRTWATSHGAGRLRGIRWRAVSHPGPDTSEAGR